MKKVTCFRFAKGVPFQGIQLLKLYVFQYHLELIAEVKVLGPAGE
ncbi:hypothetical protein [Desulfovibrio sp. JC010]|nr:hypothetical protein [Desulfovibrio sp. JC010]